MLENILIEMASQAKGSVRRFRKLRIILICLFICINQSHGFTLIYQDADHYWPMKNISDNTSSDTISYMHADLMNHDGKLNNTKLFGPAVILDGADDWIKLETMGQDCTNTPSKCRDGFTISFWLYYIRGEFVLCAGKYSSSDEGPGIKFTIDEKQKLFVIEISTQQYTWKITSKLIARDWVHVAFKWSMSEGIHLYLNGSAAQQNVFPKKEVTFPMPAYGRGWSLGRPNRVLKLGKSFGNFGIAHLAQWQRQLVAVEIRAAFLDTLLPDKKKDIEKQITTEEPTRKTEILKPSKRKLSNAAPGAFHLAKSWSVITALSLLFLLFPYSI